MGRRRVRGCEGGAPTPHFAGTDLETSTCPRREAIRHPWVGRALALYRHHDGRLGAAYDETPAVVVDAIDAIAHGLSVREEIALARMRSQRD